MVLTGASCSLAPFSATNSARSLGVGKASAELGNANSSYFIRAQGGISQNVDVGYVMEFGSGFTTSGVFAKLAFINNPVGPSLAFEGGYGNAENSSHQYGGLIGSIAFTESFETFLNARYNWVSTDDQDIELDERVGHMLIEADELKYLLVSGGFNVWFNQSMGLSIYGSYAYGDDIVWEDGVAMGGSLLLKF